MECPAKNVSFLISPWYSYIPKIVEGLVLIDGEELQPIKIPFISDKGQLKNVLVRMANRNVERGEAAGDTVGC